MSKLQAHDINDGKYSTINYETSVREIDPVENVKDTKEKLEKQSVPSHFLEPSERAALSILNNKSNIARKVIYDNEFTKMSIQDIMVQWRIHMVAILRETLALIDDDTISLQTFWRIICKKDRLLYVGITLVSLSVIMYVFNIVVV